MNKINRPQVRKVHESYEPKTDDTLTPMQLAVLSIMFTVGIVIIGFSMYGFLNLK